MNSRSDHPFENDPFPAIFDGNENHPQQLVFSEAHHQ